MIPPGYTITRDGQVKGPSGRWLKPSMQGNYVRISIEVDGVKSSVSLARLVCEAFHGPPPPERPLPVHLDGDGHNNHADNLKWGTRKEASERRTHPGLPTIRGEGHPNAALTWEEVRSIREDYAAGGVSERALATQYRVSPPTIHHIIRNKSWVDPDYTPPPPRR